MTLRNALISLAILPLFALGCSSLIGGGGGSDNPTLPGGGSPGDTPGDGPTDGPDAPDFLAPPGDVVVVAPETRFSIYIDPSVAISGDGTEESPYKSWFDLPDIDGSGHPQLQSDTGYFQRSGTVTDLGDGHRIMIQGNDSIVRENVIVGSYGVGARPHIQANDISGAGAIYIKRASNVLVQNLKIEIGEDGGSGVRINGDYRDTSDIQIDHLEITGGGFTAVEQHYDPMYRWSGLTFMNSSIDDVQLDGMFLQRVNNVWLYNNVVTRVNQMWYEGCDNSCGGDGIQLHDCDNTWIAYNYVDRSDTANKFCIISNGEVEAEEKATSVVEHNTCIGPKFSDHGGAGMMFGHNQDTVIRYNTITALPGEYGHSALHLALSDGMDIYGNIISRRKSAVSPPGTNSRVFNNVFYDILPNDNGSVGMVSDGAVEVRNNIMDNRQATSTTYVKGDLRSNNIYFKSTGSAWEDDLVIDPTIDPMFVDPDNNDFRLLPGSPAIDAGTMTGLPHQVHEDMMGTSLPQGILPDIGAIEYVAE